MFDLTAWFTLVQITDVCGRYITALAIDGKRPWNHTQTQLLAGLEMKQDETLTADASGMPSTVLITWTLGAWHGSG